MGRNQALVVSTPAILEARNLARWIAREGVPGVTIDRSNGEWGVFAPAHALGRARAAFKRVIANPAGPYTVLAKGIDPARRWSVYGPGIIRKLRGAIEVSNDAVRRGRADKAVVLDLPRGKIRFAAFRRGAAANPVTPAEAREAYRAAALMRRAARNPRVLLLTQEDRRRLPALYSQENVADPVAQVKFFTPDGNWTWFATEFDGKDTFFGLVHGLDEELGYFTLSELSRVRGPLGLAVERDRHFRPTPLSKLRRGGGAVANKRRAPRRNPAVPVRTEDMMRHIREIQQNALNRMVRGEIEAGGAAFRRLMDLHGVIKLFPAGHQGRLRYEVEKAIRKIREAGGMPRRGEPYKWRPNAAGRIYWAVTVPGRRGMRRFVTSFRSKEKARAYLRKHRLARADIRPMTIPEGNPLRPSERGALLGEARRAMRLSAGDVRAGHRGAAEYWKGRAAGLCHAATSMNPCRRNPVEKPFEHRGSYTDVQRIKGGGWSIYESYPDFSAAIDTAQYIMRRGVVEAPLPWGPGRLGPAKTYKRVQALVLTPPSGMRVSVYWRPRRRTGANPCGARRNILALTPREIALINRIPKHTVDKVERKTPREFDLRLEGTSTALGAPPVKFSAWLPLLAIAELTRWPSPEIARMTDYPEMVREGDWSGIRDSSNEKIWAIFHRFVLPKLGRSGANPRRRSRR